MIGIIQPRGLGDIIIALPIARYFAKRGRMVLWPIDRRFMTSLERHAPYVAFLPFDFEDTIACYADIPEALLVAQGCSERLVLLSHLEGQSHRIDQRLSVALKFDEYKYAIAGVPFAEKWRLEIQRDDKREQALIRRLDLKAPYVLVHRQASNCRFDFTPDPSWAPGHRIVEITDLTEDIFDWLGAIEGAAKLVLIDSVFANLVDQLGLDNEKYFVLRSSVAFTPVLRGTWTFLSLK